MTITRGARFFAVALITCNLAACGHDNARSRIDAFGTATNAALERVAQSYEDLEATDFEDQIDKLDAAYKADAATANPKAVGPFLNEKHYRARLNVLEGLGAYADALSDIMSDDQLDEFDEATKAFGTQLGSLVANDFVAPYSDGSVPPLLASAVNAIGRFFIQYKRERTVREIVATMHPHVKNACDGLRADIAAIKLHVAATANQLIVAANDRLLEDVSSITADERRARARRIAIMHANGIDAARRLDGVTKALDALETAHGKLDQAFEKDTTDLDSAIRALVNEVKRVRDFHRSFEQN